jgi:hypothetical protein
LGGRLTGISLGTDTTTLATNSKLSTNNGKFFYNRVSLPSGYVLTNSLQGDTFVPGYNRVMTRVNQNDALTRNIFKFTLNNTSQRLTQFAELFISGQTKGEVYHFNYRYTFVLSKINNLLIQILNGVVVTDYTTPAGLSTLTLGIDSPNSTQTSIRVIPPSNYLTTGAVYVATLILYGGEDGTGNAFKVVAEGTG